MKKLYVIYRKYCCDGGSMKSWNAIAELKEIYPTGIKEVDYSTEKEFKYRKDAKRYCIESGYAYLTSEDLDKMWNNARAILETSEEAAANVNAQLEELKQGA